MRDIAFSQRRAERNEVCSYHIQARLERPGVPGMRTPSAVTSIPLSRFA